MLAGNATDDAKREAFKNANLEVAILCNHQHTVEHNEAMGTIKTKVYLLAEPNMIMFGLNSYSFVNVFDLFLIHSEEIIC